MPINQPSNQIKLTNVSLVRMRKGKKRFELACYQNKVRDWRSGTETNLDDVLQVPNVFLNVSKGLVAPSEDLKASFGTTDVDKIILEILKKGELQVGEKERQAKLSQLHNEVVDMVASKCVNPSTRRPYTTNMIDKTLSEIGFNMSPNKSAKSLALDAIKLLVEKQIIPIARAQMRVRISDTNTKEAKRYKDKIEALFAKIQQVDATSSGWECVGFIDPGQYRQLTQVAQDSSKGRASVEVLDMTVIQEGETTL